MRTVRQDPEVDDDLEEACEKWGRAHEAWDVIIWVLSHDPTKGTPLSEGGKARSLVYEGSWAHDMPTIITLYEYDSQYVTIRKAKFVAPTKSAGNA